MTTERDPLVTARPYGVTLPAGHGDGMLRPLIVVLHGYTANGAGEDGYLGISALADERQTIVAYPDGTMDPNGSQFWNATDGCCNFGNSSVDDVAYLAALIGDAIARYDADPKRIFLVGHSNGAFMAHRMACDRSDLVTGIAAFAGEVWNDTSKCKPSTKLAILQIHGDADDTIHYTGGMLPLLSAPYPSTPTTVDFWKGAEGCTASTPGAALDLDSNLAGAETTVTRYTGCATGGALEHWRIVGGNHIPIFTKSFASSVYDFLAAHPRP